MTKTTYFVLTERQEDPHRIERPIFVGLSEDAAIAARDLRCAQIVGIHQIIRQNRFEAGESVEGSKVPHQFLHLFTIMEIPVGDEHLSYREER